MTERQKKVERKIELASAEKIVENAKQLFHKGKITNNKQYTKDKINFVKGN